MSKEINKNKWEFEMMDLYKNYDQIEKKILYTTISEQKYPERIITKTDKDGIDIKDGKYLSKPMMPILTEESMKKRIEVAAENHPDIIAQWKLFAQSVPKSSRTFQLQCLAETSVGENNKQVNVKNLALS